MTDKHDALETLRRPPEEPLRPIWVSWRWLLVIAAAVLFAALAGGTWWYLRPQPVLVQVAEVTVEGGLAGSVLNASGYVVAQQQATIAAQITGMVTEVLVHEGEKVEKGQLIARLDDRAVRSVAEAAAGQLQAGEAAVEQYKALAERYRRDLQRKRVLAAEEAVSQAGLEEAVADYKQTEAQVAYYTGLVTLYRNNLDTAKTQLSYAEIRAPFAGVVTERYAHPGEMISPQAVGGFTQTGICTIVDMSSLEVDVDVNETFIARLSPGQTASIVLDAYPDLRLAAHVITIVPTANQQKATVKVRVAFDKPDARVLPQMSAQVWFEAGTPKPGEQAVATILVPQSAIHTGTGSAYVYRLEDGTVQRVTVRTAPARKGLVRILSGLSEGDRVVTSSESPLTDGKKVRES